MAEDLKQEAAEGRGQVICGDARLAETWDVLGAAAGAVVSSPPYLNNYDYADATRLELYFWGTVGTWHELTSRIRAPMIAGSTQQTSRPGSRSAVSALETLLPDESAEVKELAAALKMERAARPRGKEYDQLALMYFRDMTDCLIQIREHTVVGAPTRLVLGDSAPYGVHVDTPSIIGRIAKELGFELHSNVILRQRGLRWHSNGQRHAVPLCERLVALKSPGPSEKAQKTVRGLSD